MKERLKSPELRFPGFTDDWEERKLGEHSNILTGGTPKTSMSNYWNPKEIPWMSSGEVNKRRLNETDNMISKEGLENSSARWVKENSIVIALAGQGKTRGTVAVNNIPLTTNQSIAAIEPYETLNFEFIFQNLSKRYDELRMMSSGDGTRGGLNKKIIYDIIITAPILEEQQKIGSFFKQLDNTIALHQRKLDLLKEQKKGYLQKMFPKNGAKVPELRFAGFADDWEERKLGDTLTELKSGLSRMLSNNDIGLPVVRANNINDGQFNIDSDVKYWYVNDPQGANTGNYLIRKNDILINFINSEAKMGTATIVENTPIRDTIYTTNILRARLKKEYDSYYWFALTQINQYKINIKIITKPAVNQASFTTVDFKKLNFMFPNLKEQQKIGSFFKQLDDTIALHQRKLDLLKEQKKGFLQKMFV